MPAAQFEQEFCPSCGDFVDHLDIESGWCVDCTGPTLSSNTALVASRIERWLAKFADTIEDVMQRESLTARVAIAYVATNYKAICIICLQPIKHGTYGRHFICNSTPECKKSRRRYKYLVYDKGYTKQAAIAVIVQQDDVTTVPGE